MWVVFISNFLSSPLFSFYKLSKIHITFPLRLYILTLNEVNTKPDFEHIVLESDTSISPSEPSPKDLVI